MWALLERWRIDLSCSHVCMSHGTHAIESWRTHGEVMSHIWMSRVNQSYYISEHPWNVGALSRVMAPIWTSHVTRMIESRHTHINKSWHTRGYVIIVTHTNESCHTYKWGTSQIRVLLERGRIDLSCGTRMNESWHTYKWVMAHPWISHVTRQVVIIFVR